MKRWVDRGLHGAALFLLASLCQLNASGPLARGTAAETGEPSRAPVLRIETGMHTAVIRAISIDRDNRYLVTASDDKTARVWELASGKMLRVLRPPIGEGDEGKLYAVALSPDGRTVVTGGWTKGETGSHNIYIFERESGRILGRIAGLPDVILHLTYSPDGSRLAAALGGKNGIRVYETSGYRQLFADSDFSNDSYGADFSSAGWLVTSCADGFLRLYEPTADNRVFRLVAKRKVERGGQPFSVSFSPDGNEIAVGFADSTNVAVVSERDLSPLFAPSTDSVDNGSLCNVAWSADGRALFAGGRYETSGQFAIRYWSNGGNGQWRDVAVASSTIMQILPTRDGGVVFGAADPALGRVNANGKRTLFVPAATADYRDMLEKFLLSADGTRIQFGYQYGGKLPARFSLTERQLATDATSSASLGLAPPVTSGIAVSDWKSTYAPKLNVRVLKLAQNEMSYCLAILPDQSHFLLGTSFGLHLFDHSGGELWQKEIPAAAWSVNISGDGRLAVAALGDGTIRWYRMADRQELLAFFPHSDRKRWVLWTPSGYYDCSPGAEGLIGWHVNNARDQAADFFPVAQFRDTYYRPDVIVRVLETGDEARALALANQEAGRAAQQADIATQLPPVVEILSPANDTQVAASEITIRYRIRTPSGEPVIGVKALVDGRPIGTGTPVQESAAGNVQELHLTVPPRDSTVSIIAENRYAASVPATVRLKWGARDIQVNNPPIAKRAAIKPTLYVLAVGVRRYANEKYNLQYADKDADDFVRAMVAQKGLLYRDVVVYHDKALTNVEASKDNILDGLEWIGKETTNNDYAMVFFAGHGINDKDNHYFFCPYSFDPERLMRTGIPFSDIKNAVEGIAGKAVFFVDSCHSGNAIGMGGQRRDLDINRVINELSSLQNGVVIFSASTSSESSYERADWKNGAFTKAVVEGLNGAAIGSEKGFITYTDLSAYIGRRVKELTGGNQHPTMITTQTVEDFTIAVKR